MPPARGRPVAGAAEGRAAGAPLAYSPLESWAPSALPPGVETRSGAAVDAPPRPVGMVARRRPAIPSVAMPAASGLVKANVGEPNRPTRPRQPAGRSRAASASVSRKSRVRRGGGRAGGCRGDRQEVGDELGAGRAFGDPGAGNDGPRARRPEGRRRPGVRRGPRHDRDWCEAGKAQRSDDLSHGTVPSGPRAAASATGGPDGFGT